MQLKITEKERQEFRAIFSGGYSKVIASRLNKAGLQPSRSDEYTPKIVREVVAGNQNDFNVVLELYRYKDEILTKEAELKALREKKYNQENQ